jgi:1-phosphofructokinase family hexose kinase
VIAFAAASPSIDRLHVVEALRPGEIHRPEHVFAVAGGKALNAARAAHALGADVHAVALLGGHAGRWVAAALEAEGVTCDAVLGPGETRICLSVSGGGALTEFYEPGPALGAGHWAALEAAAERVAAAATWVGVAGSLPRGAPADGPARLVRIARAAGARVALDVSGEALALGLEARPDFVKVNRHEAAQLGIRDAAELRGSAGGGAAAITRGPDGMELATPEGELLHAAPPRLGAYPVGSGDAALGGFLTALDAGAAWPEALARAGDAAAANALVPGAGCLTRPSPLR